MWLLLGPQNHGSGCRMADKWGWIQAHKRLGLLSFYMFGEPPYQEVSLHSQSSSFQSRGLLGFCKILPGSQIPNNGTSVHGWLSNQRFCLGMQVGDLLFLHFAGVIFPIVVLVCISLMVSNIEYFLLYLLVIGISFFEDMSFKLFSHTLIRFCCCYFNELLLLFFILDINMLSDI